MSHWLRRTVGRLTGEEHAMGKRSPSPSSSPSPTLAASPSTSANTSTSNKAPKFYTMTSPNTAGAIARITKEVAHIQQGADLSLAVACEESDVRRLRALIIGPPETPYEFGFFEFEIKFGREYPIKPPHVQCTTTNSGRTRFNPNIYGDGKVCLSILGTWRGEPGEQWSSAQGLESILLSIQSLMSANPYENEPGFEERSKQEVKPKAYVAKIRHEALRISVVQRLEKLLGIATNAAELSPKREKADLPPGYEAVDGTSTPATTPSVHEYDAEATYNLLVNSEEDPFADLIKRRFLWYYDTYIQAVEKHSQEQQDGTKFPRMEFESGGNTMDGSFDYKGLHTRLERIKQALDDERDAWTIAGLNQVDDGTQLATKLAFQFTQLQHHHHNTQSSTSRLELHLDDPHNPFLWRLTLFGKPMTNLDGGVFTLSLAIPPTFPAIQPRVRVDTPIFHHRVGGSAGTLCYFPAKEDELASHLEAIVAAIENDDPTYDPRAVVNPEAFALFWAGPEKRKLYNRRLRRSAQESSEY